MQQYICRHGHRCLPSNSIASGSKFRACKNQPCLACLVEGADSTVLSGIRNSTTAGTGFSGCPLVIANINKSRACNYHLCSICVDGHFIVLSEPCNNTSAVIDISACSLVIANRNKSRACNNYPCSICVDGHLFVLSEPCNNTSAGVDISACSLVIANRNKCRACNNHLWLGYVVLCAHYKLPFLSVTCKNTSTDIDIDISSYHLAIASRNKCWACNNHPWLVCVDGHSLVLSEPCSSISAGIDISVYPLAIASRNKCRRACHTGQSVWY